MLLIRFSQLKIPSSIDEDAVATAANDSLLNESHSTTSNGVGHSVPPPVPTNRLITNGHNHNHLSNGKTTNGGHEATKRATTNGTNGHYGGENGHVNSGANVTDDETTSSSTSAANTSIVDMVGPQKASSPLAKMMTNGQNGHHSVPLNVS